MKCKLCNKVDDANNFKYPLNNLYSESCLDKYISKLNLDVMEKFTNEKGMNANDNKRIFAMWLWHNEFKENKNTTYTQKDINLINDFRKLWSEHVFYTREFIISNTENLSDLSFVTNRLLQNPKDFINVLKDYYSQDFLDKFEKLFTEHLTIAADIVTNAKLGNPIDELKQKWIQNADDISVELSSVNKNWKYEDIKSMMMEHLTLTEKELIYRLTKDYKNDIINYDKIHNQSLMMTDIMSIGIMKQIGN